MGWTSGSVLRVARFVVCSASAGGALTALATAASAPNADAQPAKADADAGSPACTFTVTGRMSSVGSCTAQMLHRAGRDGAVGFDGIEVSANSPELRSVSVWIMFTTSPQSGAVHAVPFGGGPSPFVGRAEVADRSGVEWFAITASQGSFVLDIARATKTKIEGGTGYDLHGELVVELPDSNLGGALPRNQIVLRVTF